MTDQLSLPSEAAPPRYAAWVPTASGHLSFSVVGTRLPGRMACYNNLGPASDRVSGVAAAQYRVNRDISPTLRWLGSTFGRPLRRLRERRGFRRIPTSFLEWFPIGFSQHFFLLAIPAAAKTPYFAPGPTLRHRNDMRGVLRGHVFIVGEEVGPATKTRDASVRNLLQRIEEYNRIYRSDAPAETWMATLEAELDGLSHAKLKFELYRTGELRLTPLLSDSLPAEAPPLLCRHAYYFIRDCAHNHQHHQPQDDRLLPAIRTDGDDGQDDDTTWRREVLWALTRIIGQYRRSKVLAQRRQALGVMAYAGAFQATLARIRRRSDDPEKHFRDDSLASFDFAHQRASIQVANDVSAWNRQGLLALWGLIIATVISICALWVATARLVTDEGVPHRDGVTAGLVWLFYRYPEIFLGVSIASIVAVYVITYGQGSFDPVEKLRRNFLGVLLAAVPRRINVRKAAVSALLLAALAGLLEFQFGLVSAVLHLSQPIGRLLSDAW